MLFFSKKGSPEMNIFDGFKQFSSKNPITQEKLKFLNERTTFSTSFGYTMFVSTKEDKLSKKIPNSVLCNLAALLWSEGKKTQLIV